MGHFVPVARSARVDEVVLGIVLEESAQPRLGHHLIVVVQRVRGAEVYVGAFAHHHDAPPLPSFDTCGPKAAHLLERLHQAVRQEDIPIRVGIEDDIPPLPPTRRRVLVRLLRHMLVHEAQHGGASVVFRKLVHCYHIVLLRSPCPFLRLRKQPPLHPCTRPCPHARTHRHTHTRTHTQTGSVGAGHRVRRR